VSDRVPLHPAVVRDAILIGLDNRVRRLPGPRSAVFRVETWEAVADACLGGAEGLDAEGYRERAATLRAIADEIRSEVLR
jgi:hypothetical protein